MKKSKAVKKLQKETKKPDEKRPLSLTIVAIMFAVLGLASLLVVIKSLFIIASDDDILGFVKFILFFEMLAAALCIKVAQGLWNMKRIWAVAALVTGPVLVVLILMSIITIYPILDFLTPILLQIRFWRIMLSTEIILLILIIFNWKKLK